MKKILLLLGLGALVLTQACGSATGFAAKVDNTTINQSELDRELSAIKSNTKYKQAIEQNGQGLTVEGQGKGTFNSAFVARVLTQEIVFAVVHREVVQRKLAVTQADLDATRADIEAPSSDGSPSLFKDFSKSYQDTLVRRLAETSVLEASLAGVKLNDAAITDYYNKNKDSFSQTCVRHILVDSKDAADAARARVAGGEDFGKVAQSVSKDTGSAAQGGNVGCDISQFVAPFKDAASTLPVNELSQPVQTEFGFHIIQVTSRDPKPLDAALKGQIRNQLIQPGISKAQDLVYTSINKAKVNVNPRIGKFQKGDPNAGQSPQVVPNDAPPTSTTVPGPGAGAPNDGTGGAGAGSTGGAGTTGGGGNTGGAGGNGSAGTTPGVSTPANP